MQLKENRVKVILACLMIMQLALSVRVYASENDSANVITVEKADIAAYDASTIVELLNRLPGISTTDAGTLSIGGFSASDIIVTLDGRPINDQTITAKYIKWGEVDYSSVIRIEIHKISSRCSGGEINIFTEKSGDKTGGRVKAWLGTVDNRGIEASLNKGVGDYFFNVSQSHSIEGEHHHNNNDEENSATQFKAALERDFMLSGTFSYSKEKGGSAIFSYDTEEKTRPADSDDYYPDPTKSRYRDSRESYGTVINFEKGDLSSEVFMNDNYKENNATGVKHDEDGNVIYETDQDGNVSAIPFVGGNEVDVREYGINAGIKKDFFNYGLRAVRYIADFSKTSTKGEVTEGDADEYLLDLSGGLTWRGLSLSANAFYHKDYGIDIFPKIAYSKQFKPFYWDVSFTSTKKYPSLFQKYFSTSTTLANPDLDPQTNLAVTLKVGGDHSAGKNEFSWQLAPMFNKAYDKVHTHTYFEVDEQGNIIIDQDTGQTTIDYRQYDNLEEAYWTGGDVIIKYNYDGRIGMDGQFTLDYTKDEVNDSSFTYTSPYKFKGRLFWKPADNLNLQMWCTYYSKRYADQAETYAILWYYYLDFKASWRVKDTTEVFFEAKNFTDFDYYIYRGYPGNSRRLWIGIETRF